MNPYVIEIPSNYEWVKETTGTTSTRYSGLGDRSYVVLIYGVGGAFMLHPRLPRFNKGSLMVVITQIPRNSTTRDIHDLSGASWKRAPKGI
jgi:hypothetical protein